MDTSTLPSPGQTAAPHSAPPAASRPAGAAPTGSGPSRSPRAQAGLGAELRESLLLLGFAVGTTVGLTTAAQAAIALL